VKGSKEIKKTPAQAEGLGVNSEGDHSHFMIDYYLN
jgi:hypothetical protein